MSTRKAEKPYEGLAENRYMSRPEYAELRGLNAVYVKDKAAISPSAQKRALLWFLQAKSLQDGGLRKLAADLVARLPGRFTSIIGRSGYVVEADEVTAAERFLVGVCIDPKVSIRLPGEDEDIRQFETERARHYFPALDPEDAREAAFSYSSEKVGAALLDYRRRHDAAAAEGRYQTAIGRKISATLDFGLKTAGMVMIDGREGRGKTDETKAWCQRHLGEARYVSLKGINSKTAAFRELGKALGIASSYARKVSEMQARVEDVLERSKLMLVIDEAHWLFNQSARIYTRPELMDWLVTAICNRSIPVALVTTPQFITSMAKAAHQVGWNYKQFFRRVARRVELPGRNSTKDIEGAVRWTFPKAGSATIDRIVGHVLLTKRDLSALGDIVRELRYLLNPEAPADADLSKVRHEQVVGIIEGELEPNDAAFANALSSEIDRLAHPHKRTARKTQPAPILVAQEEEPTGSSRDAALNDDGEPSRVTREVTLAATRSRVCQPVSELVGVGD
jgi:hypothetical protein